MKTVIIESPYAGNIEENLEYARLCLKDSLNRWEAPIASHLLYTQVLNDNIPEERKLWIEAWLAWVWNADLQVFYIDKWISKWMQYALEDAIEQGMRYEFRKIF